MEEGTGMMHALRRRSSATPHERACEDGGEMAVFQPIRSGCSKIVRSSHPQYNRLRRLSVTKRELSSSRRDRTGSVLLKALRRRSSATPHNFTSEIGPRRRPKGEAKGLSHKRACEDGGEMAVFQQPASGALPAREMPDGGNGHCNAPGHVHTV